VAAKKTLTRDENENVPDTEYFDSFSSERLDFPALVHAIRQAHDYFTKDAILAVNIHLTIRNWAVGWFIYEYEQDGADRAVYGEKILQNLSLALKNEGLVELSPRTLRQCRQFYKIYPSIWQTPSAKSFESILPHHIWQTLSSKSVAYEKREKGNTIPPEWKLPTQQLLSSLSFSHFVELTTIEDPFKRAFYEVESIRGNWSVRALKRQIATLYYERSGLSNNPEKLAEMVRIGLEKADPRLSIRDPYIFEFLGLKAKDAVEEAELEAALVSNLREFLLELGHGFCLEAQQKSIIIGNTRGFIDLVFYHRILKCHVLVELKVDEFHHEYIGQLNTYVSWYRKHMMSEGDNPPIGLLLCTRKDHALVEYALSAINNRLFVSKYQVELPSNEELQRFLQDKRRELGGEA